MLTRTFSYEIWKRDAVTNENRMSLLEAAEWRRMCSKSGGKFGVRNASSSFIPQRLKVDPKRLTTRNGVCGQPKVALIYYVADNSIFIAPQFPFYRRLLRETPQSWAFTVCAPGFCSNVGRRQCNCGA